MCVRDQSLSNNDQRSNEHETHSANNQFINSNVMETSASDDEEHQSTVSSTDIEDEIDTSASESDDEETDAPISYTTYQLSELEQQFHYAKYMTRGGRVNLAHRLALIEKQVKIWFQVRRAIWASGANGSQYHPHVTSTTDAPIDGHNRI